MAELTREQFLRDVRHHQMRVLRNDGLYRHLQFANPSTRNQWFEILTWPGALAMSGDMGSWLFRREQDMFGFFRSRNGEISPQYWHEKLGAIDRDGAQEFDADEFRRDAIASLDNYALDAGELADAQHRLGEYLSDMAGNLAAEIEMRSGLLEWEYGHVRFEPDDIPSGLVWTHRYLWACHAIVWAIEQFDKAALGVQQRSTQILAETVPE